MKLRTLVFFGIFTVTGFSQNFEVAYLKYFRTNHDFIAGNSSLVTEVRNQDHLVVSYDEQDYPILKTWVSSANDTIQREILGYSVYGSLESKYFLNKEGELTKIIKYGESDSWYKEFRQYSIPRSQILYLGNQQTEFIFDESEQITKIIFQTVDQIPYGEISFSYDYLGFLQSEIWRTLPEMKIIRRFYFSNDIIKQVKQIWEYGIEEELVNYSSFQMTPDDYLYNGAPPKAGNILEEADIIMDELKSKIISFSNPEYFPTMEYDRLILRSGQEYQVKTVTANEYGFQVRIKGEENLLTIPRSHIVTLTSKGGEILYPR